MCIGRSDLGGKQIWRLEHKGMTAAPKWRPEPKSLLSDNVQADGRVRRWAQIPEMEGKYLRVILLADGETIHNAFFDRSFEP